MENKNAIEIIKAVSKHNVIMSTDPRNRSLKAWEDAGEPVVICLMDKIDNVFLWEDQGYGELFLIKGNKLVDHGKDFVSLVTKEDVYVGLGIYYGESQAGLYKKRVITKREVK